MAAAQDRYISTRATGIVGIAILCSRVLGLIREVVIAALFGATRNMDAFLTAFRAPNMLRDLFAEGALSTAFVTTFSRRIATEGDKSAWRLASKVATLTLVFMSALTLLGIVFAPVLIKILAPGFPVEKAELTILLTRIRFPLILLVSLAALAMGMLNAKHVFGMPAMASSFFNLGSIIGGVALCYWLDPQPNWRHPHFGERGLVGLPIATLIGGFLQLIVQFPSLGRVGFRFRLDFNWRSGRANHSWNDGAGNHRRQRGASERGRKQHLRLRIGRWGDCVAEHRFSPHAITARNFRCGGSDGYFAVGFAQCRRW